MNQPNSRYVPCAASQYDEWARNETVDFVPNERQQVVVQAVQVALDAGLYYTSDVLKHCTEALSLTPEQAAVGAQKVEGGNFGMDLFYARQYLDAKKRHEAEQRTWLQLSPILGKQLGTLTFNDYKRNTGMQIVDFVGNGNIKDGKGLLMVLKGKRGAFQVTLQASASQVRNAIDRAAEKGSRKDNFEQYLAGPVKVPRKQQDQNTACLL